MKVKWFVGLLILLLAVSCQKEPVQQLELVKDGVPAGLRNNNMRSEKGFLVGEGEFGYQADQAVFGDVISMQIKMSINDFKGFFGVRLGDNNVGHVIVYRGAYENYAILEKPRENIVGPLITPRGLNNHWNKLT